MTLPNFLTFLRILLTPLVCIALVKDASFLALLFFIFASLTDFGDGYLAGKMNCRSDFGAWLDPLADKILILVILFFLAGTGRLESLSLWPSSLIIVRELFISSVRGQIHPLPVLRLAKFKTIFQIISLISFIHPVFFWQKTAGNFLLWIAAILSWASAGLYFFTMKLLKK